MDFSELSSYPMVANTDYSPTNEAFSYDSTLDKAYIGDSYSTQPDYSLDSFFDCPVSSIEQSSLNSTSNSYQPTTFQPTNTFGTLDQFSTSNSLSFDELTNDSFPQDASPTPSLCGDGPQLQNTSPSLSPRSLKRESPDSPTDLSTYEPATKRPQRKRGRPRLDRTQTSDSVSTTTNSGCKKMQTHRLPHNQVERKYREGLNSELERLRKAVPTLPQSDEAGVMGQPKPSKAMVLAGAIEYIRKIERERDAAVEQLNQLRGRPMPNYAGWPKKEDAFGF
jgi:hypothetical protein